MKWDGLDKMFISQVLGTCKSSLNGGLKHTNTNPTTNAHTPEKSVSNKKLPSTTERTIKGWSTFFLSSARQEWPYINCNWKINFLIIIFFFFKEVALGYLFSLRSPLKFMTRNTTTSHLIQGTKHFPQLLIFSSSDSPPLSKVGFHFLDPLVFSRVTCPVLTNKPWKWYTTCKPEHIYTRPSTVLSLCRSN